MTEPRVALVVGHRGWTHVGQSLVDAGCPGWTARLVDVAPSLGTSRFVRAAAWRLTRRPPRLSRFGESLVKAASEAQADVVITTGASPVSARHLAQLGRLGVRRVNVSTDDPWNPTSRAAWFLRALPQYDTVFTPRRANEAQLRAHGVPDVRWLPFGYDPRHCSGPDLTEAERGTLASDILFVGGGDADRRRWIAPLADTGHHVALYGEYWPRWIAGGDVRGLAPPDVIRKATQAARIVLVLPRHANRDGHTMRSLEAAAIGACLLAEDTPDHRSLYGDDGAVFFSTPDEAAARARELLADPSRRAALAVRAQDRVRTGGHTYADRLRTLLDA